jgi:hypothetical protein
MTALLHLWWLWLIAALGFLLVYVKKETISAVASAVWKAAKKKFFGWFSKNLPHQKSTDERTYRGILVDWAFDSEPPKGYRFTLDEDGVRHIVPIWNTNLLSEVKRGWLVEIDTKYSPIEQRERILRVRIIKRKP